MGQVVNMGRAFAKEMLEVVDELRARIINGEIVSLAIVAEVTLHGAPRIVMRGRFTTDPYRALAALNAAEVKVMVRREALRTDFNEM
jgi:hypothetical protein